MKNLRWAMALSMLALTLTACSGGEQPQTTSTPASQGGSWGQTPSADAGVSGPAPSMGKVAETMDSGGYTYALIDSGTSKAWVAAPQTPLKVGDTVRVESPQPMPGYTSKTLNKTFDMIYFAGAFLPSDGTMPPAAAMAGGSNIAEGRNVVQKQEVKGVSKASGGVTVADLYGKKSSLAGTDVKVRGKVVKVSRGIMGKNWFHVQDGTGGAKDGDITVTSTGDAQKDDVVTVSGKLVADKDFGMGYRYDLIIEDADISVEK